MQAVLHQKTLGKLDLRAEFRLIGCHFETRKPIWNQTTGHMADGCIEGMRRAAWLCKTSQRNQGRVVLEFGGHPIGLFPQMNYLSGEHTLKETL